MPDSTRATQTSSASRAPTGRTRGRASGPRPPATVEVAERFSTSDRSAQSPEGDVTWTRVPPSGRSSVCHDDGLVEPLDLDPVGDPGAGQVDFEVVRAAAVDRPGQPAREPRRGGADQEQAADLGRDVGPGLAEDQLGDRGGAVGREVEPVVVGRFAGRASRSAGRRAGGRPR